MVLICRLPGGNNWTTWFLRFFSNPHCSDAEQSDSLGLMGREGCFWCDVQGGGGVLSLPPDVIPEANINTEHPPRWAGKPVHVVHFPRCPLGGRNGQEERPGAVQHSLRLQFPGCWFPCPFPGPDSTHPPWRASTPTSQERREWLRDVAQRDQTHVPISQTCFQPL